MPRDAKPVRVLMVLESNFPVHGGGGAESQVRTLALRLRERGHRVTVLTPRRQGMAVEIERYEGIPICRIGYPHIRLIGALILWLRLFLFLRRHGRRYDAWHVHIAHYLGAVTCAAAGSLRKPVVVKVSGWWELKKGLLRSDGGFAARIGKRFLQRATAVQAISRRIEQELLAQQFAPSRIVALPNAIDTRRFGTRAAPDAGGDALRTAIYVGRLVPEKGLDVLFEAWAKAFPQAGRARLLLVGAGSCEDALRAQSERLGIAEQMHFLGHRDDIDALLRQPDFGVLPSTIEGLSNTMLEFMASCVPVIASRVSGSEDFVVTGRNGWLFPSGDRDALALCLAEAAAMTREQLHALGCRAREDVAERAGVDVVVDRLLALYRGADPARTIAATVAAAES